MFVPLVRYLLCWRVLIMLLCAVTGADLPSDGGLKVQCVSATGGGQQDPEEHVRTQLQPGAASHAGESARQLQVAAPCHT